MAELQRVSLDEIVVHFQELEDPRSTVNRRHPLVSVIVIAMLAVLAGAGGPTAIARWAARQEDVLRQVLGLPNEITAIPELLRLVDIKGAIITIDAMGTQKAIAEPIVDGGADFVLALKGNQETLHQAVIDHIDEPLEGDLAEAQELVTTETGHGREETRTYLQFPAPEELPGFTLWKGLKSIGLATTCCLRDG